MCHYFSQNSIHTYEYFSKVLDVSTLNLETKVVPLETRVFGLRNNPLIPQILFLMFVLMIITLWEMRWQRINPFYSKTKKKVRRWQPPHSSSQTHRKLCMVVSCSTQVALTQSLQWQIADNIVVRSLVFQSPWLCINSIQCAQHINTEPPIADCRYYSSQILNGVSITLVVYDLNSMCPFCSLRFSWASLYLSEWSRDVGYLFPSVPLYLCFTLCKIAIVIFVCLDQFIIFFLKNKENSA